MLSDIDNDFYCSQKFWWLTVNLEKLQISSCCAASPHKVDMSWVDANPGQLFNSQILQHERILSLNNQPAASCNSSCWQPEFQGLPSRRIAMKSYQKTHNAIQSDPEYLNIVVGSDCNMTCVYCCKFYSTAWSIDVMQKNYCVNTKDDRFVINTIDKTLYKLSQKKLFNSTSHQKLFDEVKKQYKSPALKHITISGGEPFLYFNLQNLLQDIPKSIKIEVWSGLGVNESRFKKEVSKLPKNISIVISAENTGHNYEFVRYGNSWQRFQNNLQTLQSANINYRFAATVTNLTLFGLLDFIKFADKTPIAFQPCTDPDFLSVAVLDPVSKSLIKQNLQHFPDFIVKMLNIDPTEKQVNNLKLYIKEFSNRRNLNLEIFPKSFTKWIE